MSCPICSKRKPQRYCPAKVETICAVCCGTEREVTIDCPADCPYLIAARRYEEEHRKPRDPGKIPFPDEALRPEVIYEHEPFVAGLVFTILKYAQAHSESTDSTILEALHSLAETTRTLVSGIYFERPPDTPLPRGLYEGLTKATVELKQSETQRTGSPRIKDSEVFQMLVLMLRLGTDVTNGRRRSRAFLDYLRSRYPETQEVTGEPSRIIVP